MENMDITQIAKINGYLKPEEVPAEGLNAQVIADLKEEQTKYGLMYVLPIVTSRNEKTEVKMNKFSLNFVGNNTDYGMSTENWIGKKVHIKKYGQEINGGMYQVIYVFPYGLEKEEMDKELRKITHIMDGYKKKKEEPKIEDIEI